LSDKGWYVDCANCGRQTLVEGIPGELCEFGNHSPHYKSPKNEIIISNKAPGKEIIMANKAGKRQAYFEEHKEDIIRDYDALTITSFLTKWHMATLTWAELKKLWNVEGKAIGMRSGETAVTKHRYIEAHKAEILADIRELPKAEVMEKWGIGTVTYSKLGKGIEKVKAKARRERKPKAPAQAEGKTAAELMLDLAGKGVAPLTEHERFLMLLGYQQATREFLAKIGRPQKGGK